ncbi:hypothetical protein, partial [Paenibacillus lignilyticus]|uniref:hypothetical protein n=1 Tax=Paenibacillus lignilyticus TaxID=1172615 RepID=UPI001B33B653
MKPKGTVAVMPTLVCKDTFYSAMRHSGRLRLAAAAAFAPRRALLHGALAALLLWSASAGAAPAAAAGAAPVASPPA